MPVDCRVEIDAFAVVVDPDVLGDPAVAKAAMNGQAGAQWAALDDLDRLHAVDHFLAVLIEDVDVPGVPGHRPVLEDQKLIAGFAWRQHLSIRHLVANAR